jgi:hypothetical protein
MEYCPESYSSVFEPTAMKTSCKLFRAKGDGIPHYAFVVSNSKSFRMKTWCKLFRAKGDGIPVCAFTSEPEAMEFKIMHSLFQIVNRFRANGDENKVVLILTSSPSQRRWIEYSLFSVSTVLAAFISKNII